MWYRRSNWWYRTRNTNDIIFTLLTNVMQLHSLKSTGTENRSRGLVDNIFNNTRCFYMSFYTWKVPGRKSDKKLFKMRPFFSFGSELTNNSSFLFRSVISLMIFCGNWQKIAVKLFHEYMPNKILYSEMFLFSTILVHKHYNISQNAGLFCEKNSCSTMMHADNNCTGNIYNRRIYIQWQKAVSHIV